MPLVIHQPSVHNVGQRGMPARFYAIGTVKGNPNVKRVQPTLVLPNGSTLPATNWQLLRVAPLVSGGQHQPHEYYWVIRFLAAFPGANRSCTLTVDAIHKDGSTIPGLSDSVTFDVKPATFSAPTIAYPDPGHLIQGGQRNSFMPFGASEIPVTSASIDGVMGTKDAVYIAWDPMSNEWYAVITDLDQSPGPGGATFAVANDDGSTPLGVSIHTQ